MSVVIRVEHLSKAYQLGQIGTGTISRDLERWWTTKVRGKDDPFLKVGEVNDRTRKGESDMVWALNDVSFEVKAGEVLGIIGRNGAGKSTLLKILSRTTSPTRGQVKIKGRIASLLEVGTGFHPELTGRENIFLNGAILGMTKREIKSKFDEIVDFSGVERYIDTPVKRYSSGMYVRLAFAVAAHLEPEILVVDEVLAVGDAEFQKKALGKMKDVSQGQGRTVLFVSHNMGAMQQLCDRGILLQNGEKLFEGGIRNSIEQYILSSRKKEVSGVFNKFNIEEKDIELVHASVQNEELKNQTEFDLGESIIIKFTILCKKSVPGVYGYVAVRNMSEDLLIESDTFDYGPNILESLIVGENVFHLKIQPHILAYGEYRVYLSFASSFSNKFLVDVPGDVLQFSIIDHHTRRGISRTSKTGYLLKWEKYAK